MTAIITKVHGSRSVYIRVFSRGPVQQRHIKKLILKYRVEEDLDPGQASESMVPWGNLRSGKKKNKELGDSQVEEPDP